MRTVKTGTQAESLLGAQVFYLVLSCCDLFNDVINIDVSRYILLHLIGVYNVCLCHI